MTSGQLEQKAEEYLKAQCQKRKEEFVIRMPEVYIVDIPQAFIDGYNEGMKQKFNTTKIQDYPLNEWYYLEDGKFPENYKRVLITVLDDEGKRVVVSGMFVTKIINRNKKTKKIFYWLYDSNDVFVTSGSPGECSKPIAWMPFPEPPEEI